MPILSEIDLEPAAKAITFQMAMTPEFRAIQQRIVANAQRLATRLQAAGWRIVTGGTDTHLFLVDAASRGLIGWLAEGALEAVGICVNRNIIPYDLRSPLVASGVRIGPPPSPSADSTWTRSTSWPRSW